jgi:hypothetical protein
MISPVRIFDGNGNCMDGRQKSGLAAIDMLRGRYRAMFFERPGAPVSWIWLLDDDATFAGLSQCVITAAIGMTMDDRSVLILGNRLGPVVEVLAGLRGAKARGVGLAEREGLRTSHAEWLAQTRGAGQ